jgi:hypothetical protein
MPAPMQKVLVLTGLPAFATGVGIVKGLGQFGISEIVSFMITMPILLFAWFYFVGWLLDRRTRKRIAEASGITS